MLAFAAQTTLYNCLMGVEPTESGDYLRNVLNRSTKSDSMATSTPATMPKPEEAPVDENKDNCASPLRRFVVDGVEAKSARELKVKNRQFYFSSSSSHVAVAG
jgi:hypothetical protein